MSTQIVIMRCLLFILDAFVNSQEWTLSRSVQDLKLVCTLFPTVDQLFIEFSDFYFFLYFYHLPFHCCNLLARLFFVLSGNIS